MAHAGAPHRRDQAALQIMLQAVLQAVLQTVLQAVLQTVLQTVLTCTTVSWNRSSRCRVNNWATSSPRLLTPVLS